MEIVKRETITTPSPSTTSSNTITVRDTPPKTPEILAVHGGGGSTIGNNVIPDEANKCKS